jgi:DoxX-like family
MVVNVTEPPSKKAVWTGRAMSVLVILFLTMDAVMKLVDPSFVQDANKQLDYSSGFDRPLGLLLLAITVLYALPATTFSGPVLMTGYLGGAVASHFRIGSPLFSHILFAVYIGILAWGGMWLRDTRPRRLFPFSRR